MKAVKINNRLLGIIAMLGSPFLLIDFLLNFDIQPDKVIYKHSHFGGLYNFIYITALLCSIIGLYRINAAGNNTFGKFILKAQILLFIMADGWNIYEIISPGSSSQVYAFLSLFWPVSNIFMLFVGTVIIIYGKLPGLKKYIPFFVGLWFPLNIMPSMLWNLNPRITIPIGGIYAAISCLLLAITVYNSRLVNS